MTTDQKVTGLSPVGITKKAPYGCLFCDNRPRPDSHCESDGVGKAEGDNHCR